MNEIENNAYFWQKLDTLYFSGTVKMVHQKGEHHKQFYNLIYPVDYGYLTDVNKDPDGVSVYLGSGNRSKVSAVIAAADILQKSLELKLLAGCTDEEEAEVLRFLNQTDYQKTILVHRGNEIPAWGISDN